MNSESVASALTNIDEQFIVEAHAERVKPIMRKKTKFIISSVACACACAVTLCVCLPLALSDSTNGTALPPHTATETPPDVNPPNPPIVIPPIDNDKKYIEQGFVSNGMGEPISPLMIAYKMERQFDENGDISVQLAFGEFRHEYIYKWGTKLVISVYTPDGDQTYVLKELTAAEFLTPEYDVTIKCTIEENEYGELTTTAETRTFNHQETFTLPRSIFSKDKGVFIFYISAYDGDEYITASGRDVYYAKRDGKIDILTYREYTELDQADQTPPKTDITVTPAN